MAALHNIALFIFSLFFSLCIFVVLLRILLQFFGANSNNPVCQMTAKMTNPIILPLKNILPRVGRVDLASLLVLFILEFIKFSVFGWLQHVSAPLLFLLLMSFTDILLQMVNAIFYAIIIRVILSWINSPGSYYINEILYAITEPMLSRIRCYIPPIAGMDLSPLVAFVILKVIEILILSYLPG